jgi:hypothetical protein
MFNELRNLKNQVLAEQRKALQTIAHVSRDCPAYRVAKETLSSLQAKIVELDKVKA